MDRPPPWTGRSGRFVSASPPYSGEEDLFAALDLGTNNCRLMVATQTAGGFRVVDSYSRMVRLGEGLHHTGKLHKAAMHGRERFSFISRDDNNSYYLRYPDQSLYPDRTGKSVL